MSPLAQHDQLNALADVIRRLRLEVLNLERGANDLSGDDATCATAGAAAFMARAQLDHALHRYFDLAEIVRDNACPVHGEPNPYIHACPDCVRVSDRRDSRVQLKSA